MKEDKLVFTIPVTYVRGWKVRWWLALRLILLTSRVLGVGFGWHIPERRDE